MPRLDWQGRQSLSHRVTVSLGEPMLECNIGWTTGRVRWYHLGEIGPISNGGHSTYCRATCSRGCTSLLRLCGPTDSLSKGGKHNHPTANNRSVGLTNDCTPTAVAITEFVLLFLLPLLFFFCLFDVHWTYLPIFYPFLCIVLFTGLYPNTRDRNYLEMMLAKNLKVSCSKELHHYSLSCFSESESEAMELQVC